MLIYFCSYGLLIVIFIFFCLPLRELLRHFGEESLTCIEAETDRILVAAGFPFGVKEVNAFSKEVDECVEKMLQNLEVEQEPEYTRRRDMRSQCVFTIDPRTARDLDDALHIRRLSNAEIAALEARGAHGAAYEVFHVLGF